MKYVADVTKEKTRDYLVQITTEELKELELLCGLPQEINTRRGFAENDIDIAPALRALRTLTKARKALAYMAEAFGRVLDETKDEGEDENTDT